MRKALGVLVCGAMAGLCAAVPVAAQSKATAALANRLVLAQCAGSTPCNTSGITFTQGAVRFDKIKQPDPVFTSVIGRISLEGVIPPQNHLDAVVSARISYGSDPNGNCPQANTQVVVSPWATSSLTCLPSGFTFYTSCRGDLNLVALVPPQCSDVAAVIENVSTEVYEDGFVGVPGRLIARDGQAVPGRTPDCDSGGSGGCP